MLWDSCWHLWFELLSLKLCCVLNASSFDHKNAHCLDRASKRNAKHTFIHTHTRAMREDEKNKPNAGHINYHLLMLCYRNYQGYCMIVTGHSRYIYYFNNNNKMSIAVYGWKKSLYTMLHTNNSHKESIIKDHISNVWLFRSYNCNFQEPAERKKIAVVKSVERNCRSCKKKRIKT